MDFENRHVARTYLFIDGDKLKNKQLSIVAYFSLSFHVWHITENEEAVSKSIRQKIDGLNHTDSNGRLKCHFPMYLIGQLGRSDSYDSNVLNGQDILEMALSIITIAQDKIGGRFSLIECADISVLKKLYTRFGYKEIQMDEDDNLISFIKKLN